MYTPHVIITYLGLVFFAIGTYFLFPLEHLIQTNINFSIIPNIIFGITISSSILVFADFLKEIIVKIHILNSIQNLLKVKFETELLLHQTISKCYLCKMGKIRVCFFNMANFLYCAALPLAVALMITVDLPNNRILTGLTILTFGLIISLIGFKEQNNMKEKLIKNDLFCKFYKEQAEKQE